MPQMPPWAEGARIVYDTEMPLAFIRRGRRNPWHPYYICNGSLRPFKWATPKANLDRARQDVIGVLGSAIERHIEALHPAAIYTHMRKGSSAHMCGVDYSTFKTVDRLEDVTCPECIAVIAEDLEHKVRAIGMEKVAKARQTVRDTREFNAMGRAVTGEDATRVI